jgi:hypothetical protein
MALTFSNQAVIAFKNLSGKSNTDVDKFLGNEAEGIFQNVDFSKVWTNIVGPTPSITVGSGFAIFVTASLVVDSTSNGHAYFALWPTSAPSGIDPSTSLPYSYGSGLLSNVSSSDRVIDSIPSSYGYLYEAKPFDNTSSAISVGDPRDWVYQYQSGVFFQQDNVGNLPASIALYAYTGNTLQEELGSLGVGSITGITAGNGLSGGGTQGFINLDVNLLSSGGLTFSGDDIAVDYSTLSYQLSGNGLTSNGGTLSVNLGINGGLTYSGGTVVASVDGTTIQIIDGYLVSTTEGDISGVTAGAGLSGGGTQGFVTLDVNLGINSGLTFSGDDIIIDTNIAGNGLVINNGILSVTTSQITSALAGNGLTANGATLDVNVNSDSLEIVSDVIRLKDTITGDRTFQDSVTVGGNLTINGTVSYIYTENLMIEDNIITLNATFSTGSPFLNAGIEVLRGSSQSASLIWDESLDLWSAGLSGSTSTIITESGIGLTKSGNILSTDILVNGGLTYSGNQIGVYVDGTTIQIIDGYLVSTTEGDISGVTAGNGLSGGGTQGFVTLDVNLGINSGLTFSGDDIAVDYSTLASQLSGIGLTSNGGILSSDLLINGGLTYSGNQIGVYVDGTTIQIIDGYLVSTTEGDISGVTAGAGLSGGGTQGFVTLDVNLLALGGLTFSGNDIAVDYSTLSSQLAGIGLTSNGGTLSSDLLINGGLTYSGNQIGVYVDGTTIQIIDGYLVSTTEGDISGVTAGDGLSGGGTQGFVTLDVNTGLGLTISNDDVAMVWGGTSSGLTFSNNAISIVVDSTSLVINSLGELSVVSGSSTPVYQYGNPTASTADGSQTGITLSFTPNKYSRIEVFVNGQKQRVGDDMTVDCYFSSGLLPSPLNTLSSGDQLFWNGITSGFQLSSNDVVEITYES